MKIVDRAAFLAMPDGTVFAKFEPCIFGDLMIKGRSIFFDGGDDFLYQDIVGAIDANDSGEWADKLFAAKDDGASVAFDFDCQGRDGLFDKDQLFAVWEPQDVRQLIGRLAQCLEATP